MEQFYCKITTKITKSKYRQTLFDQNTWEKIDRYSITCSKYIWDLNLHMAAPSKFKPSKGVCYIIHFNLITLNIVSIEPILKTPSTSACACFRSNELPVVIKGVPHTNIDNLRVLNQAK